MAEDPLLLWRAGRFEEARVALVQATERSVYRFLKAMVRDEDAARDLTQDTFVRAFQSLGSFRGEASLTTWMLTIARHLAFNRARRRQLESRWHVTVDVLPDVADPRAVVDAGESQWADALAHLPVRQREAVVLFYLEDLGIDEISRFTHRPANTIKSDLHRARAILRAVLEDPAGPHATMPDLEEAHDERSTR